MEEWQVCNWAINGWARRSFFVFFSYAFKEAAKMTWKFEGEEVVGGSWDMVTVARTGYCCMMLLLIDEKWPSGRPSGNAKYPPNWLRLTPAQPQLVNRPINICFQNHWYGDHLVTERSSMSFKKKKKAVGMFFFSSQGD